MIKRQNIILLVMILLSLPFFSFAFTEQEADKKKSVHIIETLVEGSQEQPNVIYITPWQENEPTITIGEKTLEISLPKPLPVVPKAFNKKLNAYKQQETATIIINNE